MTAERGSCMKLKIITDWLEESGYEFSFKGDYNSEVSGFAALDSCGDGKITWIKKRENYEKLSDPSVVTTAVIQEGTELEIPNQIISANSKEMFFAILHHFWGEEKQKGFVGQGTYISKEAVIDPTVYIGYNCSIVGNIRIGADTVIENNAVIQGNVTIGERCHIQSGAVIGIDGCGYTKDPVTGKKTMIEHFGGVRIGNDVFIASHVNIARGTIDDTVISDGVKISPCTLVGHNNFIGENVTVISSNLFGSVKIGKDSYIVASTIQNQSEIGEHTVIGMGSVVTKSIGDDLIALGTPAKALKKNDSDL